MKTTKFRLVEAEINKVDLAQASLSLHQSIADCYGVVGDLMKKVGMPVETPLEISYGEFPAGNRWSRR
jgi:hypothetical protein